MSGQERFFRSENFLIYHPPTKIPNFASYYTSVTESLPDALERAFNLAEHHDIIQVELRGEPLQNKLAIVQKGGTMDI